MSKEEIEKKLKKLTKCKYVRLVTRGNKAIFIALQIAKRLGKVEAFIQDQGGWLTYRHHAFKLGMHVTYPRTDNGLVDVKKLKDKIGPNSVLILNSLSGYFAEQPVKAIAKICKKKKTFFINDVSGSIGTKTAKYGDVVIGSFGKWKPINLGTGAFIATNNDKYFRFVDIEEPELDYDELQKKIENLDKRLKFLIKKCRAIKKDLKDMDIIHRKMYGLNVVVKFKNDEEKERIINYCSLNNFEYTTCPREIRVNCPAVSIEVKRLEES